MYPIFGRSLENKTISILIPTLEVVMNGIIKILSMKPLIKYVLQLKTISIINLCPIVCVHLVKCTIYKKRDGLVGIQTIFLNIE